MHLPGGHYAAFLDQHGQAGDAMLAFLQRHLLEQARPGALRPLTGCSGDAGAAPIDGATGGVPFRDVATGVQHLHVVACALSGHREQT